MRLPVPFAKEAGGMSPQSPFPALATRYKRTAMALGAEIEANMKAGVGPDVLLAPSDVPPQADIKGADASTVTAFDRTW